MQRFFLCVLTATCLGCASPSYELSQHDALALQAEAVTNVAYVAAFGTEQPKPSPVGDKCDNCGGTGRLGDGTVSVKCPVCDGTGKRVSKLDLIERNMAEARQIQEANARGLADLMAKLDALDKRTLEPSLPTVDSVKGPAVGGVVLCQCPDCGCEDCECVNGVCKCPECLPDYAAARREADRLGCGLLVCSGPCDSVECRKTALSRGLIACRPWVDCPDQSGCHAWIRQADGRLLREMEVKQLSSGGYMECDGNQCRYVPAGESPWYSAGGCATGNCGGASTFRRFGR